VGEKEKTMLPNDARKRNKKKSDGRGGAGLHMEKAARMGRCNEGNLYKKKSPYSGEENNSLVAVSEVIIFLTKTEVRGRKAGSKPAKSGR